MNSTVKTKMSGAALAFAAASLMGCTATAENKESVKTAVSSTAVELVHCYDVNTCKGHNDCKTANNACKGMAVCKGQGFVAMPTKACDDVGGTIQDKWLGKITSVDLVQCFGVNVCKGHNDCKTADNACKGMAVCKGQGFVKTTANSCTDIGGNTNS